MKRLGLIEPHSCNLHRPTNNGAGFYKVPSDSGTGIYNSNLSKDDFSDLSKMSENPIRFGNALREISQLSNFDINLLLIAINNL